MISLAAPPDTELPVPFDPLRADQHSEEELDRQAFGIICLDGAGKILRYNLAEARFARLDRASVLGKRFFGVVAPCTQTPEFEGRFNDFAKAGNTAPTLRFEYVFDFKFGAQQVEIELARGKPGRFYLMVNRRKFMPVRAEPFRPAPTQAEIAPGEAQRGVQRDQAQQRNVIVAPPFFAAMRATWDRVAPQGWPLFCSEWGLKWGRLAVVDLETESLERLDRSLRELPMKTVITMISGYLGRQGWGQVTADFTAARQGAFVITLQRNALAEAVGFSEIPRCHLFAGFFRALFSHLSEKLLEVREVGCVSQGHTRCSFVVANLSRREALEQAAAQGDGDVAKVLVHLAEARDARA